MNVEVNQLVPKPNLEFLNNTGVIFIASKVY